MLLPTHGGRSQNDDVEPEDLRVAVYGAFADTGRAPEVVGLAERFGTSPAAVVDGLRELARARHLVLDPDDRIVMAHPFAAIPLGFAVMGTSTMWWGGCAWDSFALPHLLPEQSPVLVATRCPACGRAHAWNVGIDAPPPGQQVVHFLVPVAHMWDDVVHTCRHQSVFCSAPCVGDWLERSGRALGYLMDLPTLWRLARHWYSGRLERGYTRREPSEASEYLREVGLSGPFWGS